MSNCVEIAQSLILMLISSEQVMLTSDFFMCVSFDRIGKDLTQIKQTRGPYYFYFLLKVYY